MGRFLGIGFGLALGLLDLNCQRNVVHEPPAKRGARRFAWVVWGAESWEVEE